jgi:shikimate kinase
MNVYLVGLPGVGKTTTGLAISKMLNLPFIDTDQWLEVRNLMKIEEIFEIKGERYFREKEKEFLEGWTGISWIIATGGGMPCFDNNIEMMKKNGIVIYLKNSLSSIVANLDEKAIKKRPMLIGKNAENIEKHYGQLLLEREPFYLKSDLIIEASHDFKKIIGLIKQKLL